MSMKKIDFSKYTYKNLRVKREGNLYSYELLGGDLTKLMLFENLPLEIQERVGILLTAPDDAEFKGVGYRMGTDEFYLRNH